MNPVRFFGQPWSWLAVASVLLFFSVSGESLWIDEARTHRFSSLPEFGDFVRGVTTTPNSEAQMPGYLLVAWVSDKLLGASEWAMRAQNYLWGGLALFFFWRASSRHGTPWMVLLLALHPFFWYYMDEARPYAMQVALGAWLLDLLLRLQNSQSCGFWTAVEWGVVTLLLCASTLLGVIPAACAGMIFLVLCWRQKWIPSRPALVVFGFCLLLLLGLGAYYARTLVQGAGGITLETPSWGWANLAFSLYEFLGFGGVGPGRTDLREMAGNGLASLWQHGLPYLLAIMLLAAGWMITFMAQRLAEYSPDQRRTCGMLLGLVLGGVLLVFVASRITGFSFWGRHFSPLLAPALFLLLLGLKPPSGQTRRGLIATIGVVLLGIGLAWGAWETRMSPRHQKEDYRAAAELALDYLKDNRRVLWAADMPTAAYYGLKKEDWTGRLVMKANAERAFISTFDPEVVFLSKPKDFDADGNVRAYIKLKETHFLDQTVNYFKIWR